MPNFFSKTFDKFSLLDKRTLTLPSKLNHNPMLNKFDILSSEELNTLSLAIPKIALLIAGADGNVDLAESEWASKLTEIRSYTGDDDMQIFYERVSVDFNEQFGNMLETYPADVNTREEILSSELAQINPILHKFDPEFGAILYKSLVSYANHVAKASGGLLTFGSISRAERKWVKLPMITPIYE